MIDTSALIAGRYKVGALLGTGGSASVFAAVDTRAGTDIALKVLHPHLSQRPAARAAFLTEAARAEPLRHPNIVGVLGVGVDERADEPIAWIALELAAGSSLAEYVLRYGPLAPAEVVAVIDGTLRALEAAHAIGLIHRDVSPANIMVDRGPSGAIESEGVRLLDFGLADAAGTTAVGSDDLLSLEVTGRTGVMGNAHYISPEQVRGEPVDERGDIYQVGAVLYFALTGRPPFPRSTTGQTMRAHLDTPPPVPSVIDSRIPRALDRVVVRAMLKHSDDRFRSAAAMRAAVVEVVSVDAAVGMAAGTASGIAALATSRGDVTRVLGNTVVPLRATEAAARSPWGGGATRSRPRAGLVFLLTSAAIVAAIVVAYAVTTAPTASVEAAPTTAPAPTQPPAPTEQPAVEPTLPPVIETAVALTAVPDLGRQSIGEAAQALVDAGLIAGEITYVDSASLRDTVLESRPAAGQRIADGGVVTLVVASGFNSIPDVAGLGRDAAWAAVQEAGYAPAIVERFASSADQAGRIGGTEPSAGARLAVGSSTSIFEWVFIAPAPTPTQTTPPPTTPPPVPPVPNAES